MTEFETATLAARDAALWVAIAQVAIGAGQIAIVWYGIRAMQRMGQTRAREQDQRHAEAMAAFAERREADAEQREALRALIAGQDEQRAASAEQREALRVAVAGLEAAIARAAQKGADR